MLVLKFGGTSVADAAAMRQAAELVVAARDRQPLVVVSAMAKVTDGLFAAARRAEAGDAAGALELAGAPIARAEAAAAELVPAGDAALAAALQENRAELEVLLRGTALLRELSPRTCDAIVAHGERLSTAVFAAHLRSLGVRCALVDAREVVRTDDTFGEAVPQRDAIRSLARARLVPLLREGAIVVTQGYVGATATGFTTTLGRGGGDWSAALLGEAIAAEEVQIWTDVEGVLTADPRIVPDARPIARLSFAAAAELAAFGAKVLHPATIQPAVDAGIPVTVRHTRKPAGAFTAITAANAADGGGADRADAAGGANGRVTALATRGPVTMLTMTSNRMLDHAGYLARLFGAFGELDVSVDLVATAEVAVSCTVESTAPVDRLVRALQGIAQVEVTADRAIVAVVGERLRSSPRIAERAFGALAALGDAGPELVSMGGNDINLSFVVPQARAADAVRRLHAAFFGEVRS